MDMPMFMAAVLVVLVGLVTLERIRLEFIDQYQGWYTKLLHSAFFGTIGLASCVIVIYFHNFFFP